MENNRGCWWLDTRAIIAWLRFEDLDSEMETVFDITEAGRAALDRARAEDDEIPDPFADTDE